jgi:hypothetical protein
MDSMDMEAARKMLALSLMPLVRDQFVSKLDAALERSDWFNAALGAHLPPKGPA